MKPLPHDAHAERVVLSGILREPDLNRRAFAELSAADFYEYPHRLVFAAAAGLWCAFEPVDLVGVYLELRRRRVLRELGVNPALWLADLFLTDPSGAGCGHAAWRVRAFAAKRAAVLDARQAVRDAMAVVI